MLVQFNYTNVCGSEEKAHEYMNPFENMNENLWEIYMHYCLGCVQHRIHS